MNDGKENTQRNGRCENKGERERRWRATEIEASCNRLQNTGVQFFVVFFLLFFAFVCRFHHVAAHEKHFNLRLNTRELKQTKRANETDKSVGRMNCRYKNCIELVCYSILFAAFYFSSSRLDAVHFGIGMHCREGAENGRRTQRDLPISMAQLGAHTLHHLTATTTAHRPKSEWKIAKNERSIAKTKQKKQNWKFVFFISACFFFSSLLFFHVHAQCALEAHKEHHICGDSLFDGCWNPICNMRMHLYTDFNARQRSHRSRIVSCTTEIYIHLFYSFVFVLFCLFSFRWIFPLKFDAHAHTQTHVQCERRRRTCVSRNGESTFHWVARCDRQPVTTVRQTISNAGRFISVSGEFPSIWLYLDVFAVHITCSLLS